MPALALMIIPKAAIPRVFKVCAEDKRMHLSRHISSCVYVMQKAPPIAVRIETTSLTFSNLLNGDTRCRCILLVHQYLVGSTDYAEA